MEEIVCVSAGGAACALVVRTGSAELATGNAVPEAGGLAEIDPPELVAVPEAV
jgi:hypothetical protein